MTILLNRLQCSLLVLYILLPTVVLSFASYAAPGAHGPNGEHLTTEQSSGQQMNPRFETFSDQFELVGELLPDSVVLQLHHFQDNSPVIDAAVEIETADVKATAAYDEKLQHYRITAADLLTQLAKQQAHELVVTVIAAEKADLLVASYTPLPPQTNTEEHHHEHISFWFWAALGLMAGLGFLFGRMSNHRAVRSSV
ncbi:hypothetical protein Rhein_0325 [Rheinheimera sp. A13L]|uniref:hypothetical protein n=1 Tax=Rheinheimera sp. A13L TaxID=506534 RepID=UPI0002125097|nr:hypothetical protein [Rheinheimera sp. A13L]EGM79441.1 hypothetical protein Rhein_0325 [Rheinheimera sp. A13L]